MKRQKLPIHGGLGLLRAGDAAAPPLVLLHGYSGDLLTWQYQIGALARRHHVIALDLPGHGLSATDRMGHWRGLISWLADVIDALDLDRPGIVGHSLGGRLALGLAEAYPEHVSAVAVLACAGLTDRFDLPFLHSLAAISDLTDARRCARRLLGTAPLDETRLALGLLAQLGDSVVQARLRHYLDQNFAGDAMIGHVPPDWTRIDCPMLAVWGLDDTIVAAPACPPSALRTYALDHVGHMPHLTAPDTVNRLILEFFAELTPQPQRTSVAAQE